MDAATAYRTALVTGASKGIGAAIARKLVAGGLTVHGLARDLTALKELAAQLGDRFVPCAGDVGDVDALARQLGKTAIDVLVNNAGGLSSVRPLHEQTRQETAHVLDLNLTAPLQLMQLFLPGMIARGRGHVFNLTSTAARGVFPGTTTYAAAKAGLAHACAVIRYDLAGSGVRVTDLSPGRVETDFYLESFSGDREGLARKLYSRERPLAPEDIAETLWQALCMPPHVDLAEIVISPTDQAAGGQRYAARTDPPES